MASLHIRLPDDIDKMLSDLAARTGRTKTFYAKEAILKHISYLERTYSHQEAKPSTPIKK